MSTSIKKEKELKALINCFRRDRKRIWAAERKKYRRPRTRSDVIDVALGIRDGDRIPSHQCRVGRKALNKAQIVLQRVRDEIFRAKDFKTLLQIVERETREVSRFGELAAYDVAHRIGMWNDVWPKCVYLHAGTRDGAKALGLRGKKVELAQFPKSLQSLKPFQIEDFLCINAAYLQGKMPLVRACESIRESCVRYDEGGC